MTNMPKFISRSRLIGETLSCKYQFRVDQASLIDAKSYALKPHETNYKELMRARNKQMYN